MWVVAAYLCGALPFGLLIGKVCGVDVRGVGSGNIGATNVGRVLGWSWGVLCLLLDVLKGLVPVWCCGAAMGLLTKQLPAADAWRWLAVALAAVLGHIYPMWLRGRGGKGVATGLGVMLGLWPWMTLPAAVGVILWLIVVAACRYVGLASVVAAISLPMVVFITGLICDGVDSQAALPFLIVSAVMALLVAWRHRGNLARTLSGTEPKIGS